MRSDDRAFKGAMKTTLIFAAIAWIVVSIVDKREEDDHEVPLPTPPVVEKKAEEVPDQDIIGPQLVEDKEEKVFEEQQVVEPKKKGWLDWLLDGDEESDKE